MFVAAVICRRCHVTLDDGHDAGIDIHTGTKQHAYCPADWDRVQHRYRNRIRNTLKQKGLTHEEVNPATPGRHVDVQ